MRMSREILAKLTAARTRLIIEYPFIGALVMHLPLVEAGAHHCPTIATDARALYFNRDYITGLTLVETQFVLAHEALHCALAHFARGAHRIRKRWDIACDHAVNLILIQEGMRPPPGALANADFLGLTAEEIYPLIRSDTQELPLDSHFFEPYLGVFEASDDLIDPRARSSRPTDDTLGDAGPRRKESERQSSSPLARAVAAEPQSLVQAWQGRLASAARAATQTGRLSDSLARSLQQLFRPRMPWRALLARFLASVAREDYSFQRTSRRDGDALLPRLASGRIKLVIALDSSGSIQDEEMREFASEVNALRGQTQANLVLHACDDKLSTEGPWHFAPWDPMTLPATLSGGGGTRFTPVFDWIEREQLHPDLLLYFTDAQGEFPDAPPRYPVIWLVKGRAQVPWGERIQLN
jgi:predicted metal-dependent peptidase